MKEMKANGVHFGWALPSPPDVLSPHLTPYFPKGKCGRQETEGVFKLNAFQKVR